MCMVLVIKSFMTIFGRLNFIKMSAEDKGEDFWPRRRESDGVREMMSNSLPLWINFAVGSSVLPSCQPCLEVDDIGSGRAGKSP